MHLGSNESSVYVAGHTGLVGSSVVRELRAQGIDNLLCASSSEVDLRNQADTRAFFKSNQPDFVVVAAARVGGILANDSRPADFLYDNLIIQANVLRAALDTGVSRLVFLGSTCVYPKLAPQPLKEEYLLTGPLEPTNEWYAIAKIAGIKTCQAFRRQFGSDFVSLMPTNLYGPGDNFDLESSHVLPALIRKFVQSKKSGEPVTLWGSGEPRREFLYVDDLARGIVHVLKTKEEMLFRVAPDGLLNVGVGEDIPIMELARIIRDVTGSVSSIVLDETKPDGTPRKLVDVSRMKDIGWEPSTCLRDGIERTVEWYLSHRESV